jgi:hypothetical protein
MPWIKVSKDAHNGMKQYLVDVEGLSLGELVESAFGFCMENLEDFEEFLGLEEADENEKEEADSKDESETEED